MAPKAPNGVYFTSLELESARCFGPRQRLDLSDGRGGWARWTLLLGENGTGKTTLLQALALAVADEAVRVGPHGELAWGEQRACAIRARGQTAGGDPIELQFRQTNPHSVAGSAPDFRGHPLVAYGANRLPTRGHVDLDSVSPVATLFDPAAPLLDAEQWLLQLDHAAMVDPRFRAQLDAVRAALVSVLPDVQALTVRGPGSRDHRVTATPSPGFVECATPYGPVPLGALSLGYQSMLAWVVDLVARMFHAWPDAADPLAQPVVVLVDEIDLHLHPAWQRDVIGFLSRHFPRAQFVATAHSPLVVQAATGAKVAVLRRRDDHVEIDQTAAVVLGWRVDQVLTSDLFGLGSARGPEIEARVRRRTDLLRAADRSPEEERELAALSAELTALPTEERAEDQRTLDLLRRALDRLESAG